MTAKPMLGSLRDLLKDATAALLGDRVYRTLHARAVVRRLQQQARTPAEITQQILHQYLQEGGICLDIGAHTGDWTYPMSMKVGASGKVYAFEALPHYAEVLQLALARLHVDNVALYDVALSKEDGWSELISRDDAGKRLTGRTHLRGQAEDQTADAVRVRTLRLDTLSEEEDHLARVQLIKCDVEGAELWVFEGGKELLAKARPVVYCEIQEDHCRRYGHGPADVFRLFESVGYTRECVTDVDYLFVPQHR